MKTFSSLRGCCLVAGVAVMLGMSAGPAEATPGVGAYQTIHRFISAGNYPQCVPLLASDGNIYGTATRGGDLDFGTIYKIASDGRVTMLYSFAGTPGLYPSGRLVEGTDGNIYGVSAARTSGDNPQGYGTIFRIRPSGAFSTVVAFNTALGYTGPSGNLVLGGDGNFYDTTGNSVLRISPAGTLTRLLTLQGGGASSSIVLGHDGNLYGTVSGDVYSAAGTKLASAPNGMVFRLSLAGAFQELATFGGASGSNPVGPLAQGSDGNLYGITTGGGALNKGTVFGVSLKGSLRILGSIDPAVIGTNLNPGLAVGDDGNIYGTAQTGGTGGGQVFKVTPAGQMSVVQVFNGPNGAAPMAALAVGGDGNIYGTTYSGGDGYANGGSRKGFGSVFRLVPGGALTTVGTLGYLDGASPQTLALGRDGNFYGTTSGLASNSGGKITIFRITPESVLTTLDAFTVGTDLSPASPLLLGSNGKVYGTGSIVSNNRVAGVIYDITSGGEVEIHQPDGFNPTSGLIEDGAGNLYGTTKTATYKLGSDGLLANIGSFGNGSLLLDGAGNLYGVSSAGGTHDTGNPYGGDGFVFKIAPDGTQTVLANFDGSNGRQATSMLLGSDGNFYGVAPNGGASDGGAVFKLTPSGSLTALASLGTQTFPSSSLVQWADGNFYGTTLPNPPDNGSIFRVTPQGVLTTYINFNDFAGGPGRPNALVLGADGNLYGVLGRGGSASGYGGTVFRLMQPPAAPTGLTATAGSGQVSLAWNGVSGATGYNIYQGTAAGAEATTPAVSVLSAGATLPGTAGTTYYYTVTALSGNGESVYSNEASAQPSAGSSSSSSGGGASSSSSSGSGTSSSSSGSSSSSSSSSSSGGGSGGSSGGGGAWGPLALAALLLAAAARRRRRVH